MTLLEDELRRVLAAAAPEPPQDSGPRLDPNPARRKWLLPLAAAAAVVVIAAGGVALVQLGQRSTSTHDATGRTGAAAGYQTPTPAPPGLVLVAYYGISVAVPQRFGIGPNGCGDPPADAVVLSNGLAPGCPIVTVPPPRYTTVSFFPDDDAAGVSPSTVAITVDGVPARIRTATENHRVERILVVPSRQVEVAVAAPTEAAAQRIIDTVRIAPVDARGCVDRVAPLASAANAPSSVLVPGAPLSAIACEYSIDHRLIGSGPLTPAQIATATRVLDRGSPARRITPTSSLLIRYVFGYGGRTSRTVEAGVVQPGGQATDGRRTFSLGVNAGNELPEAYR